MKERQVKMLNTLDYFGESSLLGENKRNATVIVASDYVQILQLEKLVFDKLVETGIIGYEAVEHATKMAAERKAEVQHGYHYVQGRGDGMVAVSVESEMKALSGSGGSSSRSLFS